MSWERDYLLMNEPIKQHYLPKTYLKRFSLCSEPPHQLYVLHKRLNKIILGNINSIAAERHFYTVRKHHDKYVWEKFYAKNVEPLMDRVITKTSCMCSNILLQNYAKILTIELKYQMAVTIMFQLLRGKHCREFEKSIYSTALPGAIDNALHLFGATDDNLSALKEYEVSDDLFALTAMESTLDMNRFQQYVNVLMKRYFVIYKIQGDVEFITSDNPVMLIDSLSLDATPFKNGLAQHSTVIFFPISPKIIVAAYHPDLLFGSLSHINDKCILIDSQKEAKFIKTLNLKQFEQSFDQVYARSRYLIETYMK